MWSIINFQIVLIFILYLNLFTSYYDYYCEAQESVEGTQFTIKNRKLLSHQSSKSAFKSSKSLSKNRESTSRIKKSTIKTKELTTKSSQSTFKSKKPSSEIRKSASKYKMLTTESSKSVSKSSRLRIGSNNLSSKSATKASTPKSLYLYKTLMKEIEKLKSLHNYGDKTFYDGEDWKYGIQNNNMFSNNSNYKDDKNHNYDDDSKELNIFNKHIRKKRSLDFTYGNGLKNWVENFPDCSGMNQSPININTEELKNTSYEDLCWGNGYDIIPKKMTFTNNGHTLVLEAIFDKNSEPVLEKGPLENTYVLDQVHFHWGNSDSKGSEHTVNNKYFPMEMHVVHHIKGMNFINASKLPDGLAVVGYVFEIIKEDNEEISELLKVFSGVKHHKNVPQVLQNKFKLDQLVRPFDRDYVTYRGSLTTPPCSESVTWILSPNPLSISKKQLHTFRTLFTSKDMQSNCRTIQPTNDRCVYYVI